MREDKIGNVQRQQSVGEVCVMMENPGLAKDGNKIPKGQSLERRSSKEDTTLPRGIHVYVLEVSLFMTTTSIANDLFARR